MLSTPSNRQPSKAKLPPCVALIVPSHLLVLESVTPSNTRNDADVWACNALPNAKRVNPNRLMKGLFILGSFPEVLCLWAGLNQIGVVWGRARSLCRVNVMA